MSDPLAASSRESLPLRVGAQGKAVADLQRRLAQLDYHSGDQLGTYGEQTEIIVRAFQGARGIRVDGICGRETWSAVVEAGYRLGDRLLYRRTPMLRGDDIAELQRRLSVLGFDPGRIDGIFGDNTTTALLDFQRNAGVPLDRICGPLTLVELFRLDPNEANIDLVSPLRERLRAASNNSSLDSRRIGVGEQGGFATGTASLARSLQAVGASVMTYHHPDPSRNAAEANAADVECFINLVIAPEEKTCTTAFYRGFRYESPASRSLAELVQAELPLALDLVDGGSHGMALTILRETRMPAIEIRLGAPLVVVQKTAELAEVVVRSLSKWATNSEV